MEAATPRVSVIIPTHNRGILVCDNIDTLLAQDYPDYEIIYVNDGSTDETGEILSTYSAYAPNRFRAVYQENAGPGPARNRGATEATGTLFLFTDDDVLVPENWIRGMVAAYLRKEKQPVAGAVLSYSSATPVERYLHLRNEISTPSPGEALRAAPMMSFLIDRATFEEVGGFLDVSLQAAEDWEFCLRLRARDVSIAYDDSVPVTHRYQSNIEAAKRRMRATGALGLFIQQKLGGAIFPYVGYSLLRFLVAPVWVLRHFPGDLFWMALHMEWIFIVARMQAYQRYLRGVPIPPRGY